MDIAKKNEIEARLRKLMELNAKEETDVDILSECRPPACNVIRRRKGEKDKRIHAMK
ncbi:MAG: hypothetical protein ACOC0H_01090 [Thermodesulfobacteriota bacterium]